MLLTVPSPGRCRSGIQASRISRPKAITQKPMVSPTRRARPWLKTSHGMLPRSERMTSAMLTA